MRYDPYGNLKYFEPFEVPFRIQNTYRWVEIQKCPWCGERDVIVTYDNIEDNSDEIICPTCQGYMQEYTKVYRKHFRKALLKKYFKSLLGI